MKSVTHTPLPYPSRLMQDANEETAAACGISSMPTFQFYKNGKLVTQFSGASEERLLAVIAEHK